MPDRSGVLAVVAIIALVVAAFAFLSFSSVFPNSKSSNNSNTTGTCLDEVPSGATSSNYYNSTSQGYVVTYPNGTRIVFPLNSCPVPVYPEAYKVDSVIEADPRFNAAENGSSFMATNAYNGSIMAESYNSTGQFAILNFVLYGDQRLYPCGADSYWVYNELRLIIVTIPMSTTGNLQYSQMEIQESAGGDFYSCTTTVATSTTTSAAAGGMQVASIVMIQPYTPAGPTLALTLRNLIGCCITNLTAILVLNSNFTFHFTGVNPGHPLDNEQYASAVETLIAGGYDSAKNYTLLIKGTAQDTVFTYVVQTRIPSGYSYLDYLTASGSCTSSGGPTPCWGSADPFVFQCVNLLAGPASQWTCTEKVTSTIEPSQSYNITVTLPVIGQQGESVWENCEWSIPGTSTGQSYAYFIPISSTGGSVSFILADQAPPHL
jgi:hypothetical protein